jgi:hypothetical protein
MSEYISLAVYTGLLFAVFAGAVAWDSFRKDIKRRLKLKQYHHGSGPRMA